jgi:poly(hydroxyalkanoate) depolymerase family esterase
MSNPWLKKNPFMSMWLSGANSVANTARARIGAEMNRQSASVANKAMSSLASLTRASMQSGTHAMHQAAKPVLARRKPPVGNGDWLSGMVMGPAGVRRFRLFRPPGTRFAERLPLMVMLHGCHQDAKSFAASTRMNVVAARERFLVLYPEQDRMSNAQGCWNWFDTRSGRAYGESDLILRAIDQVCVLYSADRARIAVAGMSAGASMAALLASRHPGRFKAVAMHSGIPPGTARSSLSAVSAMVGHRSTQPLPPVLVDSDSAWPPLLVIHGGADSVVASNNAVAAARVWADAAGATAGAGRTVRRGRRHSMHVTDFKRRGVTTATLVEIERLAHAWSGGATHEPYSDGDGPDASRMVWAFSAKQFARVV